MKRYEPRLAEQQAAPQPAPSELQLLKQENNALAAEIARLRAALKFHTGRHDYDD